MKKNIYNIFPKLPVLTPGSVLATKRIIYGFTAEDNFGESEASKLNTLHNRWKIYGAGQPAVPANFGPSDPIEIKKGKHLVYVKDEQYTDGKKAYIDVYLVCDDRIVKHSLAELPTKLWNFYTTPQKKQYIKNEIDLCYDVFIEGYK